MNASLRGLMAKMRVAAAIWIGLALSASASPSLASFAEPWKADAEGSVTGTAAGAVYGEADVSADRVSRDAESQWAPDFSDHWALYQRLAERRAPGSSSRPDFSGDWVLNAKASDDPLEKAMQASRLAAGSGSGGMGRGGGKGHGGGMGGGRQGRGGMGGMSGGGSLSAGELSALIPAQALHMTHQDPMLLIADENDQRQRLFTDYRGASVSANGGLDQRVSVAGWEGAVLVIETTMLGKKLTQSYQIDGETGQLVIATQARLSNAQTVSYRLVYDRHKPEADGMRPQQNISTVRGETQ